MRIGGKFELFRNEENWSQTFFPLELKRKKVFFASQEKFFFRSNLGIEDSAAFEANEGQGRDQQAIGEPTSHRVTREKLA